MVLKQSIINDERHGKGKKVWQRCCEKEQRNRSPG